MTMQEHISLIEHRQREFLRHYTRISRQVRREFWERKRKDRENESY